MSTPLNLTELSTLNFSFPEAYVFLKPLLIYVLVISFYAFFVFKFYMFISKKSLFPLNRGGLLFSVLEYIILYPIIVFTSFLILTTFFTFLSKNQSIEILMLGAMSLLATVRITAYYSESLSQDLAKVIPLALLAIFLLDANYFSVENSIQALTTLATFSRTIVYYLGFVVTLEFALRLLHVIFGEPEKIEAS